MFDLSENTGSTKSSTEAVQLVLWSLLSSSLASAPLNLAAPYPCGSLRGGRSARVIGGSSASAGQFPWAVRLRNAKTNNLVHCGGSLITARHVLTAAHCVRCTSPADWQVIAGELHVATDGQIREVTRIAQHPAYRFPFIEHDLAVLTLSKNVLWDARVSPVCLSRGTQEERMAELAGWG